ncbi:hypothetical protein KC361_g205 [Hortaea werneckii]|nr:hypothetical protein KC361_g205 [Hortaea werneckii]
MIKLDLRAHSIGPSRARIRSHLGFGWQQQRSWAFKIILASRYCRPLAQPGVPSLLEKDRILHDIIQ